MKSDYWKLPPNWITAARIGLTPWIGVALARGEYRFALPLLFLAGISDAADGWLARRFNWRSELGERLDPIADKLLVAVVYAGLGAGGGLPWWLVGLVLGRDAAILVAAGALLGQVRHRRFPPSAWGKLSTVFQMTLGGLAVLDGAYPEVGAAAVTGPLIWATAAFTVISGAHYGWRAIDAAPHQG